MIAGLTVLKQDKKVPLMPCISIYLPTHQKLDNKFKTRDRIKFMRIIIKVEKLLLLNNLNLRLINKVMAPARALLENQKFWCNQQESLVVFLTEDVFEYYHLPVKSELGVFIDKEFMVSPLNTLMANISPVSQVHHSSQGNTFGYQQKSA